MSVKPVNPTLSRKQSDLVLEIADRNTALTSMLRFLEVVLADGRDYVSFSGDELTGLGWILSNIDDHARITGQLISQLK